LANQYAKSLSGLSTEEEEPRMKKHPVILTTVLVVLFLGVLTPQFAQDTSTNPPGPDLERRRHALCLLRTIDTAEVGELSNYGSYASWQTLLAQQPKFFDQLLAINYPQEANLYFAEMPEILPGWTLRFNVRAEGLGYDVRLQGMTAKQYGYAALTDESGVIWQGEPLH
jgi:hypothetical protein